MFIRLNFACHARFYISLKESAFIHLLNSRYALTICDLYGASVGPKRQVAKARRYEKQAPKKQIQEKAAKTHQTETVLTEQDPVLHANVTIREAKREKSRIKQPRGMIHIPLTNPDQPQSVLGNSYHGLEDSDVVCEQPSLGSSENCQPKRTPLKDISNEMARSQRPKACSEKAGNVNADAVPAPPDPRYFAAPRNFQPTSPFEHPVMTQIKRKKADHNQLESGYEQNKDRNLSQPYFDMSHLQHRAGRGLKLDRNQLYHAPSLHFSPVKKQDIHSANAVSNFEAQVCLHPNFELSHNRNPQDSEVPLLQPPHLYLGACKYKGKHDIICHWQ